MTMRKMDVVTDFYIREEGENSRCLLTDVTCNYFLASFLAKHIGMVLPNRGVKPGCSSSHNHAGLLSPAGLEFCDNLVFIKEVFNY